MSQDSRFKFDRMLDNDPTELDNENGKKQADNTQYPSIGHTRNLGFVWLDGQRLFLNYSYLVSGEYKPKESIITLSFTSHEVTLKGVLMEGLFDELMGHIPRLIICQDARYNSILEKGQTAVNEIKVIKGS